MTKQWSQCSLQKLITDQIEESLTLEYKAAAVIDRSDNKKKEITKDVSAMANSAGGTLIYGIAEYKATDLRHRPERIDPIDRTQFSKEWLDQIINVIRPKTPGLLIIPVNLDTDPNHVAYVVDIPQSHTAHQASDFRYYKRSNFLAVPMEDYEIRDVMARSKDPQIEVQFELLLFPKSTGFHVNVINSGSVFAQYVCVHFSIPFPLKLKHDEAKLNTDGKPYFWELYWLNVHKDLVGFKPGLPALDMGPLGGLQGGTPDLKYFSTRYDPILPLMSKTSAYTLQITPTELESLQNEVITWSIFADNAKVKNGTTTIRDIPQKDYRSKGKGK